MTKTMILPLALLMALGGCKKYEENEGLSLRSPNHRIQQLWHVDKLFIGEQMIYDQSIVREVDDITDGINFSWVDSLYLSSIPQTIYFKKKSVTQGIFSIWDIRMNTEVGEGIPPYTIDEVELDAIDFHWRLNQEKDSVYFTGLNENACGFPTCIEDYLSSRFAHKSWKIVKLDRDEFVALYTGTQINFDGSELQVEVRIEMSAE